MTLPASGPISMGNTTGDTTTISVNRELGKSSPYQQLISLNDVSVRALFARFGSATEIALAHGRGQTRGFEYICVAGGAGGDYRYNSGGGGGGGGGIVYGSYAITPATSFVCNVGAGGSGSGTTLAGATGVTSSITLNGSTITTCSGGLPSGYMSGYNYGRGGTPNGANGGTLNSGGTGYAGSTGPSYSISGTSLSYSSGGGGGGRTGGAAGGPEAGAGGGSYTYGSSALANRGGGGGGGGWYTGGTYYYGGQGGSGVIFVRYPGPQIAGGGSSVYTSGNYTYHIFNSTGTLSFY